MRRQLQEVSGPRVEKYSWRQSESGGPGALLCRVGSWPRRRAAACVCHHRSERADRVGVTGSGHRAPAAPGQAPELWVWPAAFRRAPQTSFAPRSSPREKQSVLESCVVSSCSNVFFSLQKAEFHPLWVRRRRAAPRVQWPWAPGDPRDDGFSQEIVFSGIRLSPPSKNAYASVASARTRAKGAL